jgi:predicted small metal-binding protein
MKTMNCSDMGGTCEETMSAATEEEMVGMGWKHIEAAHPEMAEKIKNIPQAEKDTWMSEFHKKWEAAPEDDAAETE